MTTTILVGDCQERLRELPTNYYQTILADPPWQFTNRTGKGSPEHARLHRYATMSIDQLLMLPVDQVAARNSHLYLWVPNALLPDGIQLLQRWGFVYKTQLVWIKTTKAGDVDPRGMGFYYRNATEAILFGVRGTLRTHPPARSLTNVIRARRTKHSEKPQALHELIEASSPGPYLELFARTRRPNWDVLGDDKALSKVDVA